MTRCRVGASRALIRCSQDLQECQAVARGLVEEPDGRINEYDRNLKATVKVTPDGERTPVGQLENSSLTIARRRVRPKLQHEGMTP